MEAMGYNYKMIGNAVPPRMAKKIAHAIYSVLERSDIYSLKDYEHSFH